MFRCLNGLRHIILDVLTAPWREIIFFVFSGSDMQIEVGQNTVSTTAIEESKDLDEIKVQELIGSLRKYELTLPSQRKSKSLALKTINERIEAQDSSKEDDVEKVVAFLAMKFRK